jgi:fructose-1,6-bisphosphatase
MSKTRRNFGATRRHIKGDDNSKADHRINKFFKKMTYSSSENEQGFSEERHRNEKIDHRNYDQYLETDVEDLEDDI